MCILHVQAQRRLQDEAAFLDGISPQKKGNSIVGGPLAASDAPSFLRLVRTGERWFELQTAGIMCVYVSVCVYVCACSYVPFCESSNR